MEITSADRFEIRNFVSELWQRIPPHARCGRVAVATEMILAVQIGADPAHIVKQAEAYYKSYDGKGDYRMKIANFISKGCYDDDPAAWMPKCRKDTGGMNPTGALERARRQRLEYEAEQS